MVFFSVVILSLIKVLFKIYFECGAIYVRNCFVMWTVIHVCILYVYTHHILCTVLCT